MRGIARGPLPGWLLRSESCWVPEYLLKECDAFGIPVLPATHVPSLVERRHVWLRLIKMDSITRANVMGKLADNSIVSAQPQELGGGRGEEEARSEDGGLVLPGCC